LYTCDIVVGQCHQSHVTQVLFNLTNSAQLILNPKSYKQIEGNTHTINTKGISTSNTYQMFPHI